MPTIATAHTGCLILCLILQYGAEKQCEHVLEQIRSLEFHIYFTTRRILFNMGGIQSEAALIGDLPFSQFNNNYDNFSYKRICAEFGINYHSFRIWGKLRRKNASYLCCWLRTCVYWNKLPWFWWEVNQSKEPLSASLDMTKVPINSIITLYH